MSTSLVSRLAKLEQVEPVDGDAKRIIRILFVDPDKCIEVKLSGHPSQRKPAQMTFHKTQPSQGMQGANS